MNRLERLQFVCQKVLPLVYDDSISTYEVVCKIVKYVNDLIINQNEIISILGMQGADIEQLKADVATLEAEFELVKNGEYVDLYLDSIIKWIDANLQALVGQIVKYVMFGLTNDGRFIAYIPPTWDFITFDTIVDPVSPLNGHLVLRW